MKQTYTSVEQNRGARNKLIKLWQPNSLQRRQKHTLEKVCSTNGVGKTCRRMKLDAYLSPCTKSIQNGSNTLI